MGSKYFICWYNAYKAKSDTQNFLKHKDGLEESMSSPVINSPNKSRQRFSICVQKDNKHSN
jgi:hypothetical protein